MADESTVRKIISQYYDLRMKAENERKRRIEEVNKKYPRLAEIDMEISKRGLENMNRIFNSPDKKDEYNADFKKNLDRLNREKQEIIKENGIDPVYDKFKYECEICEDTGYNKDGKKCICFKQKLINEAYSMSNMSGMIKNQNFETFSLDYYSKNIFDNGISSYDNMVRVYNGCLKFCDEFDNEESKKGLLFCGPTGLGKTFLSSAIAKRVMDGGKTVVYVRATRLFSMYEDYKFGRNPDRTMIENIYNCDLLIIDDLGTEPSSQNNKSFLFDIINERMAENKKIIINTNLLLNEMVRVYSQRFVSRVYEYFIMYRFFGEDIRLQKLKG